MSRPKTHSYAAQNPFMARPKPIHRLAQRPKGMTALEWEVYRRGYREGVALVQGWLAPCAIENQSQQKSSGGEPGLCGVGLVGD